MDTRADPRTAAGCIGLATGGLRLVAYASRIQRELGAHDPMNTGVKMSAEEFELHVSDALDGFPRN